MKAYMKIRKLETVTNTPVNEDSGRDKSKQELGMKLLLRKRIKHTVWEQQGNRSERETKHMLSN